MPDTLSLGFDTSAAHCAAALFNGQTILATHHQPMQRGQAEHLFPLIQSVLDQADVALADLGVIGVGIGPGNFTGIRIAVAAARGLSLSLGIPAIGVTAPEAAAYGLPRPCRIIQPTRGGEVIWQDFITGTDTRPALGPADALPAGPAPSDPITPIAEAIARIAHARRADRGPRPAPLYLRPADAAPARDRGPVMLP